MLMWVVDSSGRRGLPIDYRLQEAKEKLESVKAELEQLDLEVNLEVREGIPQQEILAAALTFDISAIAIGTDYRNNLLEWTAPSFANDLLRSSWFPVVLFSPQK